MNDVACSRVKPTTLGMIREARAKAQAERGQQLSDDELVAAVFGAFLDGNAAEPTVARYQVATVVCDHCSQGWRDAHGRRYAMDRSEVDRALCDAQHIGSLTEPRARAVQDIAPRTRRFVWRRDGGRCRVPGCRSASHLELHHIVPRALGGTHEAENLIVLCDGCHSAHHRGLIEIRGTSSALVAERVGLATAESETFSEAPSNRTSSQLVTERAACEIVDDVGASKGSSSSAHVGANGRQVRRSVDALPTAPRVPDAISKHAGSTARPSTTTTPGRFEIEAIRADARSALVSLGFRRSEAATAVDHALTKLGAAVTLESVIRQALRSTAVSSSGGG